MSSESQFMGFAHYSSDNQQLRYQRNAGVIRNESVVGMDHFVCYQPLMASSLQLNNLSSFSNFKPLFATHESQTLSNEHYDQTGAATQIAIKQSIAISRDESTQNETNKVVSMDEDTTVHGNWTAKNAKFRLFCFCEANGYPLAYIHVEEGHSSKIRNRPWMHRCRKVLNLNHLYKTMKDDEVYERRRPTQLRHINKIIEGDGKGQTRKEASEKCALSLIHHLYQLQLIETHIAPVKLRKKKEFQMEIFKIAINEKHGRELDALLKVMKIEPYVVPYNHLPKNTIVLKSSKLFLSEIENIAAFAQFVMPSWSPPCEKWDPWLNCKITEGALAEMSLDQIGSDLRHARFQQVESESKVQEMLNERLKLPIFSCISEIMQTVQNNSVTIIHGPNGCGKSTQVPQYILDTYINAGRGGECSVIVIQPRRISTVNIAERIAQERGEIMGTSCGYSIRFDSWLPRPYGSILFCTADVVLKKLKSGLRGISYVIVDEIHERDVNVDFTLLVLREMVRMYHNLRVILLSSSTEILLFSEYFSNCPVIEVPTGQLYSVTDFYLEDCIEMVKYVPSTKNIKNTSKVKSLNKEDSDDDDNVEENMNKVIGKNYLKSTAEAMSMINEDEVPFELIEALLTYIHFLNVPGAILIFLPGWSVISGLKNRLQQHPTFGGPTYLILPLHSQIPKLDVHRVFDIPPSGITKIILSSNIGESAITISDVIYIIDSCKIKLKHFTSHELLFNSAIVWASKSNLAQRRGRAGRTQSGMCFRLCSRARFEKLKDDMPAAMTYTPLDELALTIKFLRLGNIYHLLSQALHPPPLYLILQAETLLRGISALDKNGDLTALGYVLGQLPVRPQLGKMIVLSCLFHLADPFCTIVPRSGIFMELLDSMSSQQLSYARQHFEGSNYSDFVTLLNAFAQWEKAQSYGKDAGNYFCEEFCFSKSAMEITKNAKRQLKGILQAVGFPAKCMYEQNCTLSDSDMEVDMISALLLVGYHPNICFYNPQTKKVLINGTAAALDNLSLYSVKNSMQLSKTPFFVFEERVHTKPHCKEITEVTPIHLLLFGHSRVEIIDRIVVLDGWIKFKMDLQLASKLLALRKHLDAVLIEVTSNPSLISTENVRHLVSVIKGLCSRSAVIYPK